VVATTQIWWWPHGGVQIDLVACVGYHVNPFPPWATRQIGSHHDGCGVDLTAAIVVAPDTSSGFAMIAMQVAHHGLVVATTGSTWCPHGGLHQWRPYSILKKRQTSTLENMSVFSKNSYMKNGQFFLEVCVLFFEVFSVCFLRSVLMFILKSVLMEGLEYSFVQPSSFGEVVTCMR
jgi:hypothetical protein